MFSLLGQEQDQCSPFLSISQYFPAPVDTKFSKVDPSEYRVVPDPPLTPSLGAQERSEKPFDSQLTPRLGPL